MKPLFIISMTVIGLALGMLSTENVEKASFIGALLGFGGGAFIVACISYLQAEGPFERVDREAREKRNGKY